MPFLFRLIKRFGRLKFDIPIEFVRVGMPVKKPRNCRGVGGGVASPIVDGMNHYSWYVP